MQLLTSELDLSLPGRGGYGTLDVCVTTPLRLSGQIYENVYERTMFRICYGSNPSLTSLTLILLFKEFRSLHSEDRSLMDLEA